MLQPALSAEPKPAAARSGDLTAAAAESSGPAPCEGWTSGHPTARAHEDALQRRGVELGRACATSGRRPRPPVAALEPMSGEAGRFDRRFPVPGRRWASSTPRSATSGFIRAAEGQTCARRAPSRRGSAVTCMRSRRERPLPRAGAGRRRPPRPHSEHGTASVRSRASPPAGTPPSTREGGGAGDAG